MQASRSVTSTPGNSFRANLLEDWMRGAGGKLSGEGARDLLKAWWTSSDISTREVCLTCFSLFESPRDEKFRTSHPATSSPSSMSAGRRC